MASYDQLKQYIKELDRAQEFFDAKNKETEKQERESKNQLTQSHINSNKAKQNLSRMKDLEHQALLKIEQCEKEDKEQSMLIATVEREIKDLQTSIEAKKVQCRKITDLYGSKILSNATRMIENDFIYRDKENCLARMENFDGHNENIENEIKEIVARYREKSATVLQSEKIVFRERRILKSLPNVDVKKWLLKEVKSERRELALKLVQTKTLVQKIWTEKEAHFHDSQDC
uniref:Uncharacterized protein n=1 Tax=Romanomermis culicivorax TaxID=13658 RepID=A0A915KPD8_ROMCU